MALSRGPKHVKNIVVPERIYIAEMCFPNFPAGLNLRSFVEALQQTKPLVPEMLWFIEKLQPVNSISCYCLTGNAKTLRSTSQ